MKLLGKGLSVGKHKRKFFFLKLCFSLTVAHFMSDRIAKKNYVGKCAGSRIGTVKKLKKMMFGYQAGKENGV